MSKEISNEEAKAIVVNAQQNRSERSLELSENQEVVSQRFQSISLKE